jgi:UDP-N-acetylglucosamine 2-epimerase (non-hydrolysing)
MAPAVSDALGHGARAAPAVCRGRGRPAFDLGAGVLVSGHAVGFAAVRPARLAGADVKRVMLVFGTRPEVIKLAPLVHAYRARASEVALTLCATGQHRQMLDSQLAAFDMRADIDLNLMRGGQDSSEFLGRLILALRPVMNEVRPDIVCVQGDTATVMGAALTAFLCGAQVAHVEAGLRTRDKRAPFPEEVNRRVAGVVADLHFAPTARARDNLLHEGVDPATVFLTGNTVVDALRWMQARVAGQLLPPELDPGDRRLVLVTAHRRESFGAPFRELCLALRQIAERFEDICLVYPVHLNPNVQRPVQENLHGCPRVRLVPPQDYATFVALLSRAHLVLTDSGGIQEEAPALGKPVLVMRDKTERPEAIAAGVVKLVGTQRARIVEEAARLLADDAAYAAMARVVNTYGDGRAAQRIVEVTIDRRMSTPPFQDQDGPPEDPA